MAKRAVAQRSSDEDPRTPGLGDILCVEWEDAFASGGWDTSEHNTKPFVVCSVGRLAALGDVLVLEQSWHDADEHGPHSYNGTISIPCSSVMGAWILKANNWVRPQ